MVCKALIADGWTITHDPLVLKWGTRDLFVDLGAERLIAADRGDEKIAVEIKSFRGPSDIRDLELALGQYVFYRSLMARGEPDRKLFLAISESVYNNTFNEPIARPPLEDLNVALLVFRPREERIIRWIT